MTEDSSPTSDLQCLWFLRNDDRKGGKYQLLAPVECEHRPHWRDPQVPEALQVTTKLSWQGRAERGWVVNWEGLEDSQNEIKWRWNGRQGKSALLERQQQNNEWFLSETSWLISKSSPSPLQTNVHAHCLLSLIAPLPWLLRLEKWTQPLLPCPLHTESWVFLWNGSSIHSLPCSWGHVWNQLSELCLDSHVQLLNSWTI